ncbi:MAG: transketolase-like TK C-terminal-containing protein, partial [Candidatus Eiseniibacteriota bacterium]
VDGEDVYYYITLYNQDYSMPPQPEGVEEGLLRGLYLYRPAPQGEAAAPRAQLFGSGVILLQALRAQEILAEKFGVAADVWSATSYQQLRNEALAIERWNRLHPSSTPRVPYVTRVLQGSAGPVIAATDFMKSVPDMVARWVPRSYTPLGTDGFGRSDTREALRRHFEIDAEHIVVATLDALRRDGKIEATKVDQAIRDLGLDAEKGDPREA